MSKKKEKEILDEAFVACLDAVMLPTFEQFSRMHKLLNKEAVTNEKLRVIYDVIIKKVQNGMFTQCLSDISNSKIPITKNITKKNPTIIPENPKLH